MYIHMSLCVGHMHVYRYVNVCQLASSSLLRLGQETDKEAIKNRESVYLLLDEVCLLYTVVLAVVVVTAAVTNNNDRVGMTVNTQFDIVPMA